MKCLKQTFCDRDNDFDKAFLRFELIEYDFVNKAENMFSFFTHYYIRDLE